MEGQNMIKELKEKNRDRAIDIMHDINEILKNHYQSFEKDGETRFLMNDGAVFTLSPHNWDGDELILTESGDTIETPRTQYEDDDQYYINELSVEEIVNKILKDMGK